MKYVKIKGIYTEALLKDYDKHLFHENKSQNTANQVRFYKLL